MPKPARLYATLFFGVLVVGVSLLAFIVLRPFFAAIAWAIVLAVAFQGPWRALAARLAPRRGLAAALAPAALPPRAPWPAAFPRRPPAGRAPPAGAARR